MKKSVLTAAALCLAISPVMAQSNPPASTAAPVPAPSVIAPNNDTAFLQQQKTTDWRASKLIGMSITGPDNAKIGDVNDVLLDSNGN